MQSDLPFAEVGCLFIVIFLEAASLIFPFFFLYMKLSKGESINITMAGPIMLIPLTGTLFSVAFGDTMLLGMTLKQSLGPDYVRVFVMGLGSLILSYFMLRSSSPQQTQTQSKCNIEREI